MKTGNPYLKAVERSTATPQSRRARGFVFALVVAVILFLGVSEDALSQQTATAVPAEIEAGRPSRETVYFPSQYVNPGREIPEPAPTF